MNTALGQATVSLLLGAAYGLLRLLSTGNLGGSIASAVLAALFLFTLLRRRQVQQLSHVRRMFTPARGVWVSAVVAIAVAGMGVVRHDGTLHTAALDASFAFLFFLTLGSLFEGAPRSEGGPAA